ncbi:hypothetical protein AgCh_024742 [Apium graveolens]
MCTSVLLVGESKEEVSAPQFMDFAVTDLLEYAISSSQSHFRLVLGEDTDPKAICQWSVSTSPSLNPLDASADSGSDIDSSDEFNKDGDLRTPIAPPVTSLRMAKVIFLAGTTGCWSYERSDTLVRMSVNTSGEKSETNMSDFQKIFRRMVAAQGVHHLILFIVISSSETQQLKRENLTWKRPLTLRRTICGLNNILKKFNNRLMGRFLRNFKVAKMTRSKCVERLNTSWGTIENTLSEQRFHRGVPASVDTRGLSTKSDSSRGLNKATIVTQCGWRQRASRKELRSLKTISYISV